MFLPRDVSVASRRCGMALSTFMQFRSDSWSHNVTWSTLQRGNESRRQSVKKRRHLSQIMSRCAIRCRYLQVPSVFWQWACNCRARSRGAPRFQLENTGKCISLVIEVVRACKHDIAYYVTGSEHERQLHVRAIYNVKLQNPTCKCKRPG